MRTSPGVPEYSNMALCHKISNKMDQPSDDTFAVRSGKSKSWHARGCVSWRSSQADDTFLDSDWYSDVIKSIFLLLSIGINGTKLQVRMYSALFCRKTHLKKFCNISRDVQNVMKVAFCFLSWWNHGKSFYPQGPKIYTNVYLIQGCQHLVWVDLKKLTKKTNLVVLEFRQKKTLEDFWYVKIWKQTHQG